jgi:hypothetical protein
MVRRPDGSDRTFQFRWIVSDARQYNCSFRERAVEQGSQAIRITLVRGIIMLHKIGQLHRVLFARSGEHKVVRAESSQTTRLWMRRTALGAAIVLGIVVLGIGIYSRFFHAAPLVAAPEFVDTGDRLPTQEEFEEIVKSDPVKMLDLSLTRYHREVRNGMTALLIKRERVYGEPKPPKQPPEEVVQLAVNGDVPDSEGKSGVKVRMIWEAGARKTLLGSVTGTLYVEEPDGGLGKLTAWVGSPLPAPVNGPMARAASRYCMRDAGLRGAMLRSHNVWKKRQDDGELQWRFVEKRVVDEVGGRECYVVERTCPKPEVDPFEIGGEPNLGGRDPASVGSVRVTLFIDAERWLQVGSELHRQDGELLASYYFRDINLQPTHDEDAFTTEGLKKAVAAVKKN